MRQMCLIQSAFPHELWSFPAFVPSLFHTFPSCFPHSFPDLSEMFPFDLPHVPSLSHITSLMFPSFFHMFPLFFHQFPSFSHNSPTVFPQFSHSFPHFPTFPTSFPMVHGRPFRRPASPRPPVSAQALAVVAQVARPGQHGGGHQQLLAPKN